MQSRKRIEPIENLAEQADHRKTQPKILRLKSFDARIERREPVPVQIYLANLDEPRIRERTVTEDVSPTALECSPNDTGSPTKYRWLPP